MRQAFVGVALDGAEPRGEQALVQHALLLHVFFFFFFLEKKLIFLLSIFFPLEKGVFFYSSRCRTTLIASSHQQRVPPSFNTYSSVVPVTAPWMLRSPPRRKRRRRMIFQRQRPRRSRVFRKIFEKKTAACRIYFSHSSVTQKKVLIEKPNFFFGSRSKPQTSKTRCGVPSRLHIGQRPAQSGCCTQVAHRQRWPQGTKQYERAAPMHATHTSFSSGRGARGLRSSGPLGTTSRARALAALSARVTALSPSTRICLQHACASAGANSSQCSSSHCFCASVSFPILPFWSPSKQQAMEAPSQKKKKKFGSLCVSTFPC